MIRTVLLAFALGCLAAPAEATQAPPTRKSQAAPQSRFSIDTPIVQLLADPRARAALAKTMPTLVTSPHLKQFQHMSIRQLEADPHARIAASKVRALQADLVKIK